MHLLTVQLGEILGVVYKISARIYVVNCYEISLLFHVHVPTVVIERRTGMVNRQILVCTSLVINY